MLYTKSLDNPNFTYASCCRSSVWKRQSHTYIWSLATHFSWESSSPFLVITPNSSVFNLWLIALEPLLKYLTFNSEDCSIITCSNPTGWIISLASEHKLGQCADNCKMVYSPVYMHTPDHPVFPNNLPSWLHLVNLFESLDTQNTVFF